MLTWEYVEGNILRENIWLAEEKKNGEGKGGKHLEKENIWSMEEKKNRVGKGGIIWRWKINGDADQLTDQP